MAANTGELKVLLKSLLTRFDETKATDDKRLAAQLGFNEQIRHDLQKEIDHITSLSDVDDVCKVRDTPTASAKSPAGSPASDLPRSPEAGSPFRPHQGSTSYAQLVTDFPPLLSSRPAITTSVPVYHLFDEMPESEFDLRMRSLLELTQMGTVAEYTAMFWACLHHVLHLNPSLSIKCFIHQYIKGLHKNIQAAVKSQSPSSITRASCLARIREEEILKDEAMGAEERGDGYAHEVHGHMLTEALNIVSPELTTPVMCSADCGIEANNFAAPAPTMLLDTNHNTDVIDGKYLAALTPTTNLADGLGQVADMPPSACPMTTTPRSSLRPAAEPTLTRNSVAPTTTSFTSQAADVNHGVSLDTVSHYVTKVPLAMEDDLGATMVSPFRLQEEAEAYTHLWFGSMLSLLMFGDHQASAPPKPPWSFLVQEQIGGDDNEVATFAKVAQVRWCKKSWCAVLPCSLSMKVVAAQPWLPSPQVELWGVGQLSWLPPETCTVLLLSSSDSIMPVIELKPWPDPRQSQGSGSAMNKLQHDGFWMSNLLHVFIWRNASTNNLLNNYTEKQLMVDVLEFHKVAVGCYLHGVNLELESLKLYKMVSVNPNTTPRTWDPGILLFSHVISMHLPFLGVCVDGTEFLLFGLKLLPSLADYLSPCALHVVLYMSEVMLDFAQGWPCLHYLESNTRWLSQVTTILPHVDIKVQQSEIHSIVGVKSLDTKGNDLFTGGPLNIIHFQFLVFLRTCRIEICSLGIRCSLSLWWFPSDTRSIRERAPRITMYKHVRMFRGWLNYEMNHRDSIGTTVRLIKHLQPTNRLLINWWTRPQARKKVQHCTMYWPPWNKSMSVDFVETKGSLHYFRYAYDPSVSHVQELFEAAKSANDLNAIAAILEKYPYHPDSLLTYADMFKYSGEHHSSADTVEKCLFALECAWHPLFSPLQGNYQLKYNPDIHNLVFTSLLSRMKNLDRHGCHRSALEACKFLLSLDSDDLKGALFCIDSFALRPQQYKCLKQFAEEYQCDNPLVLSKIVNNAPLKDSSWTQILKIVFCSDQHGRFPGGAIENIQRIGIEWGGLNTTKHTYEEDYNFFHQLMISSTIVPKHILLPYDPGGLALRQV